MKEIKGEAGVKNKELGRRYEFDKSVSGKSGGELKDFSSWERSDYKEPSRLEGIDPSAREVARKRIQLELETYSAGTTEGKREVFKKIDREISEAIKDRYGKYIPEERLKESHDHPTKFYRDREYLDHLKKEYPSLKISENEKVVGDLAKEGPHVDYEEDGFSKTVAHERLHQFSSPEFRKQFGSRLNDGVTEYLARDVTGSKMLQDEGNHYPREQKIAELIKARTGDEVIKEAYFKGDVNKLRTSLDAKLGIGATDRISILTRLGMYDEAEKILKGETRGV